MMVFVYLAVGAFLAFLGLELALSWAPILALRSHASVRTAGPETVNPRREPFFVVVSACRDGAPCIEGLVKSFQVQTYPQDRFKLFLVADNCKDNSAAVARSFGMDVYERHNLVTTGKGNALNEILQQRLKNETFDVMVVLDVDARVEPDFLRRAAAYFSGEPLALSCATFAKNPEETLFTRVGTLIQALLRVHQEGRAALGLGAVLYGSHGYAVSRAALERLDWHTTTGLVTEDMELRLRCTLESIPVRYAPDLSVYNDVTADAASTREQRRRWNSIFLSLFLRYVGPLTRKSLQGSGDALEALFGLLLFPAFANLFLYCLIMAVGLSVTAFWVPSFWPFAIIAVVLWLGDIAYFFAVFRAARTPLKWRDLRGFAAHIGIRLVALLEAIFFIRVKNWAPAPHQKDR
jgi:1,2-diacylglycerol 3-beta-glucosyltransferase